MIGPSPRLPAAAVVAAADGAGGREVRGGRLPVLLRDHRQQTGERGAIEIAIYNSSKKKGFPTL